MTTVTLTRVVDACFKAGNAYVAESKAVLASAQAYADAAKLLASGIDAEDKPLSLGDVAAANKARLLKIDDKGIVKELKRSGTVPTDKTAASVLCNVGRVLLQGGPLGVLKIAGEDVVVTPRHVSGWLQAKGGDGKIAVSASEFAKIIMDTDSAETSARALYRAVKAAKSRKVEPPEGDADGGDSSDQSAGGILSVVPSDAVESDAVAVSMLRQARTLVERACEDADAWGDDVTQIADEITQLIARALWERSPHPVTGEASDAA